ncbi:MAG TPA: 2-C-methyl-D-erythritol 2,4-cyclodiphosphate synthase [Burkholderiaceae bacterium]|nr:2-C-methyl-D-erythritol 2,4-cyclodiphosphate synthase [Burkholderiaceae bacterium]
MRFRVGQGFDAHALVPGRRLVLAGVELGGSLGLLGHSDADVVVHAAIDALLGASAQGDIGEMFPDGDARYQGADSMQLLAVALERVRSCGWQLANIDCTVIAQQPKIAPFVDAMRRSLADALALELSAVSIKAKTTERLGFTGRGEGIAALVVVALQAE